MLSELSSANSKQNELIEGFSFNASDIDEYNTETGQGIPGEIRLFALNYYAVCSIKLNIYRCNILIYALRLN
jgi:hypothetical protein